MLPFQPKRNARDIVAIGASAGGVEAVDKLISLLPADLAAAVLVVVHRDPGRLSFLADVLSRKARLKVVTADQGNRLEYGVCYVGAPDRHLTVGPGPHADLMPDHFYRSHNIDALFNSLARNAGSRTIGVILSGMLKDGTQGLKAIKECGGVALVQSPEDTIFREMPENAISHDGSIDLIAPIPRLAEEICRLVGRRKLVTSIPTPL